MVIVPVQLECILLHTRVAMWCVLISRRTWPLRRAEQSYILLYGTEQLTYDAAERSPR